TATTTLDTIHVAPSIAASGTVTFNGGGAPVLLDSTATVTDSDSFGNLFSASVIITDFIAGDTLTVGTDVGLGTAFSNCTLTLTGTAALATYQAALDSIAYSFDPANGDPTTGGSDLSRTITWSVNDGVNISNTATTPLDTIHV